MQEYDLEDRLISFSVLAISVSTSLENSKAGNHLAGQIVRSGTSVSLNYGEAQAAESRRDFIHKIKIVLKELRETFVCLKIIRAAKLAKSLDVLDKALRECDELIAIFVKSVQTAQNRKN